jgi:hypothetical protein
VTMAKREWDHQMWERHARKLKVRPMVKHEHDCFCGGVFRCSQSGAT